MYTLIIFLAACEIPCEPIWVDPRPFSFEECRLRRNNEISLYEVLRDTPVFVNCRKVNDE